MRGKKKQQLHVLLTKMCLCVLVTRIVSAVAGSAVLSLGLLVIAFSAACFVSGRKLGLGVSRFLYKQDA